MEITVFIYIIITLTSFSIGWFIANVQYMRKKTKFLIKQNEIMKELYITKQQVTVNEHWRNTCEQLNNELHSLKNINNSLKLELRDVTTRLESTQLHTEDKINQLLNNEQRIKEQFENLAHRIFKQQNYLISKQNQQNLNSLLIPLRDQLDGFRRQVQDNFSQETRERHTLVHEIRHLQELNSKITQETVNLTRALKGNNKTQGNWGEIVLTRVLESSGLRHGYEYETQVKIKTNMSTYIKPDVIVHLPQGKHIIIDAKMTLVAYERYFNAEDECTRESALQAHITSIRNHISILGRKEYQEISGLHTLDFILMFIPIEPAFLLALNTQPELLTEALKKNIMLVSPTTLLVALRTISNCWNYEYQSQNTQQIAERATKLYDKMRLFIDDMSSIGQNLERAQNNYRQAMKKLTTGRGNILTQAEAFRSLGIVIKREINSAEVTEHIITKE